MKSSLQLMTQVLSFALGLSALSGAEAESVAPDKVKTEMTGTDSTSNGSRTAKAITEYGQTFVLVTSQRTDEVETEEYFLKEETTFSWTEMITYQRIVVTTPEGTDRYVARLRHRLDEEGGGARMRVVQQGRVASLFGVYYAKTSQSEEQFVLGLVTIPDSNRPNELHVVQYAVNPQRVPMAEMEMKVKRWQSRFQSQATSMGR